MRRALAWARAHWLRRPIAVGPALGILWMVAVLVLSMLGAVVLLVEFMAQWPDDYQRPS